jgi:ACS family hexuronate transporter-like MFS transporter
VASDRFPKGAVASVTGIGGCAGGLGGFLFSAIIPGFVVTHFGYTPMFVFTGTLHVLALFGMSALLRTNGGVPTASIKPGYPVLERL